MTELDHLDYLRNRSYRRKAHAAIRKFVQEHPGDLTFLTVLHECNDACCRREPWSVTRLRLVQALADDGLSSVLVASATADGASAPRNTS